MSGNLDVSVLNSLVAGYNATGPAQTLPEIPAEGASVGLPFFAMGKTGLASSTATGSRYFVIKGAYELYAAARFLASGGASEDVFGAEQEAWLFRTFAESQTTWRVMGNSCSMTSMTLCLRQA